MFLERKISVVWYGLVRVDRKFPNRSSSLWRARSWVLFHASPLLDSPIPNPQYSLAGWSRRFVGVRWVQRTCRRHFHGPLGGANGNSAIAPNASSLLPSFFPCPAAVCWWGHVECTKYIWRISLLLLWCFARLKATADAQMTTTCFQFPMTLI